MTDHPTIDALFRRSVQQHPQRDFLRHVRADGPALRIEATTYAEAASRTAATVLSLRELGLTRGDTVISWCDDAVGSIYFFLACFHVGAIPIPLAPSFSIDYLQRVAQRTQARWYAAPPAEAARLLECGLPTLCFSIADTLPAPSGAAWLDGHASIEPGATLRILTDASRDHGAGDALIITPTSGSTGEPKLPMWSHRSMAHAADNLRIALGWSEASAARALLANAPTHGLGLTLISGALQVGATLCVPSQIDTQTPLAEVRALDFSHSFMTPRVLKSLHEQHLTQTESNRASPWFGPGAQAIAFAGAPPPLELFPALAAQGVDPIDVWGSSETGNIACSERGQWQAGCLRPFPGIEVRVGAGSQFELRSSHFFLGYFGDPEQTRQVFTPEGYYLSGDAGEILPDGLIRITGRTRDVFNTHEGSNIWPGRIETLLEGLGGVRQAILIGDRLPFCSALLVLREGGSNLDADGVLPPAQNGALYEVMRVELQQMNKQLETVEQVRRFLLVGRPFPTEVYGTVGAASKTRRDRAAIGRVYAARIQQLYEPVFPSPAMVPLLQLVSR